ncbi:MAG: SPOR domain-containing protein [bacterium]
MTGRRIFLIVFLLLSVSCGSEKKGGTAPPSEKREEAKNSKYSIIVSSDGYSLLDSSLEVVKRESAIETITASTLLEKRLYLLSSNLKIVNAFTLQTVSSSKIFTAPSKPKIIANRQGAIFISGSDLVFKDKNKEHFLLSIDSPILQMYENPYHSYIYCTDSLGFLYAIDFVSRTLKRRFFIGKVNSFTFAKYGTRILAVTDKSFLVLDYETLNIIFEKKDFFTTALSFETGELMFLYSGMDKKCWIYSNIDYKKRSDFTTDESDISLFTADDSLMLLFSREKKTLTLFNKDRKVSKKRIKLEGELSLLEFNSDRVLLKNDSLVFSYNMKNDSIKKVGYYPHFISVHSVLADAENEVSKEPVKEDVSRYVYSIQIYALSNSKYAEKITEEVKTKTGIADVFVSDTTIAGKVVYRVFAGKFNEREDSDLLREQLIRMGYGRDILVKRIKIDD